MTENLNKQNVRKEGIEEEPIVYAIQKDLKGWKFSRRDFLKGTVATAEVAVVAGAVAGCGGSNEPTPIPPTNTLVPTKTPTPKKGTVQPGKKGINYTVGGQTYTLPCGSSLPKDAVCTCNCVTVPRVCSCDRVCTCDRQGGTYWYPN